MLGVTTVKTEPKKPQEKVAEKDTHGSTTPLDRKDFKISGEISDKIHGLSFVNLIRQIESGLRNSYTEADINEGVTRAISPALPLRLYLEG
jgi:hypothetical protein